MVRIKPHGLQLLDESGNEAITAAAAASDYNLYKATNAVAIRA